jgi:hypothetical protein
MGGMDLNTVKAGLLGSLCAGCKGCDNVSNL